MGSRLEGEKLLKAVRTIYYLNKADIHDATWKSNSSWYYRLDGWLLEYHIKMQHTKVAAYVLWACDVFPRGDGHADFFKGTTFYLEPVENES